MQGDLTRGRHTPRMLVIACNDTWLARRDVTWRIVGTEGDFCYSTTFGAMPWGTGIGCPRRVRGAGIGSVGGVARECSEREREVGLRVGTRLLRPGERWGTACGYTGV